MLPAPALASVAQDTVWCLGLGLLLAFGRDILGWGLGNGRLLCFLWDLLAFAAAAFALRGFAAAVSASGTVRWYMVLGMVSGALGWRWAVAGALQAAGRAAWALLLRPWRRFCRCIAAPAAKKLQVLMKSMITLHQKGRKMHEKKAKSAKKQLQNPSRMLYN